MHEGTVVYVSELAPTPVRAVVQTYDAPSGRWRVELQGSQWQGRTLLVPEEALRISFCILPSSLSKLQTFVDMTNVDAQGVCGRGLIVNVPVKKGSPILAEPPLCVAGALVMPHRTHHSERWLAFAALQKQAKAELQAAAAGRASSFEFSKALAAFNDLGMADQVPSHVREGAENIATKLFGDPSRTAEVSDVLMKFHSNQFRLDNGAEPADTAFAASGVYPCMSRINHSCAPTMNMTPARLYAQLHGAKTGTSLEESGAVLLAFAARDLVPGDRLTISYGPAELASSWSLQQRREYLLRELGFKCGCERCVAEEAGQYWTVDAAARQAAAEAAAAAATVAQEEQQAAQEAVGVPTARADDEVEPLHLEEWQIEALQKRMEAMRRAERVEEMEPEVQSRRPEVQSRRVEVQSRRPEEKEQGKERGAVEEVVPQHEPTTPSKRSPVGPKVVEPTSKRAIEPTVGTAPTMAPSPTVRKSEMKPPPAAKPPPASELRPAAEAPCMPSAELERIQARPFVVEHLICPPAFERPHTRVIAVSVVAVVVSVTLLLVVKRYR